MPGHRHRGRGRSPRGRSGGLRHLLSDYWDHLLGISTVEYAPHRTTSDYIWNTAGQAAWGLFFPLLTVVVTQLVGIEEAGLFSLGFVTANVLLYVANYGVRAYQVSDVNESNAFVDYQIQRWTTCAAMLGIGILYCLVRGYSGEMFWVSVGLYLFRMLDGAADVYEGRLQQKDKLYLAGISQTIRSVAPFVSFSIALFITRDLILSTVVMDVFALAAVGICSIPLAIRETPRSRVHDLFNVRNLFVQCFPLFIALFFYNFIESMPKFIMEGVLGYDSQLLFNAICFPAQSIVVGAGLLYKPLLVRLTDAWADTARRKRFDAFIASIFALIAIFDVVVIFLMDLVGIPIMNFMYGIDFRPLQHEMTLLLIAGGFAGGTDFLYQVITVIRRQSVITRVYLIAFAFSILSALLLENLLGFDGAIYAYLANLTLLCALLMREYVHARRTS
jgi:O-antigen/teichoic acid export membrane protein